jgi:hypothetical protein
MYHLLWWILCLAHAQWALLPEAQRFLVTLVETCLVFLGFSCHASILSNAHWRWFTPVVMQSFLFNYKPEQTGDLTLFLQLIITTCITAAAFTQMVVLLHLPDIANTLLFIYRICVGLYIFQSLIQQDHGNPYHDPKRAMLDSFSHPSLAARCSRSLKRSEIDAQSQDAQNHSVLGRSSRSQVDASRQSQPSEGVWPGHYS